MSLSPESQALIAKLGAVHQRASSGDREAVHFIKSLKTRAFSGDAWSRKVYNTLAVLHHRKKQGPGVYDKAEAYYLRLVAKDPSAMAKLQTLIQRVRAGDDDARRLFSVLRSIHGKHKSSAFTAAAPSFSGYGYQQRSHHSPIIGASHYGHGGGYPMNQSFNRGFIVGNAAQPLTVQAVANLIGLMVRVRAMPLAAALFNPGAVFSTRSAAFDPSNPQSFDQGASPGGGGGGGGFTTVPQPSGISTVPQPSGMTTAVKSLSEQMQAFQTATAPQGAPPAAIEAYKTAAFPAWNTDMNTRYSALGVATSAGQYLVNSNPAFKALGDQVSAGDPEKLTGFFFGAICSLGNTAEGPGQNKARDELLLSSSSGDVNNRRTQGFNAARQAMYAHCAAQRPIILPTTVNSLGRVGPSMTDAQRAAALANQGICNSAASALARNSPATPGLMRMCSETRRSNIMSGQYFADNLSPNDPAYRVALTDAGKVVVDKNPQLQQFAQSLMAQDPTGARTRGFIMAMGVRAGKMDPKFPAFVRPGLSTDPNLIAGFDTGMSMQ